MTGTQILLAGLSKIGIGLVVLYLLIDFHSAMNVWSLMVKQEADGKGVPAHVRGVKHQAILNSVGNMVSIVILLCIAYFVL